MTGFSAKRGKHFYQNRCIYGILKKEFGGLFAMGFRNHLIHIPVLPLVCMARKAGHVSPVSSPVK